MTHAPAGICMPLSGSIHSKCSASSRQAQGRGDQAVTTQDLETLQRPSEASTHVQAWLSDLGLTGGNELKLLLAVVLLGRSICHRSRCYSSFCLLSITLALCVRIDRSRLPRLCKVSLVNEPASQPHLPECRKHPTCVAAIVPTHASS